MSDRYSSNFNEYDLKYSCIHVKKAVKLVLLYTIFISLATLRADYYNRPEEISNSRRITLFGSVIYPAGAFCLFLAILRRNRWFLIPYSAILVLNLAIYSINLISGSPRFLQVSRSAIIMSLCGFVVFKYFVYLKDRHSFKTANKLIPN